MGEVWRATDTKLGRDVTIKILPESFAQNADRMARFAREAQVPAALNHRAEVFIRRFTADGKSPGAPRQVSTAGGFDARWRGDGKEIFFVAPDSRIRAVELTFHGDEIRFGVERRL